MKKYSDKQRLNYLHNLIFKERSNLDCEYLRENFDTLQKAIDFFIDITKKDHTCDCYLYKYQVCDICQNVVGKKLKDKII